MSAAQAVCSKADQVTPHRYMLQLVLSTKLITFFP